jgi:hypothetical protein
MQEIAMMTDRELSDIGLSRAGPATGFQSGLCRQPCYGRGYIAY